MALAGCFGNKSIEGDLRKAPRPVEVMTLVKTLPPSAAKVSASAASWKTEEIGFEVNGRVEWVIEPGMDIQGRILDENRNVLIEGTPIARVESKRYSLQLETAKAEVSRAEQNVVAIEIERDESLQAQMRAAKAELNLAVTELGRSERLEAQDAGAKADVDRDKARKENAESQIKQLEAMMNAKQAEWQAAKLQVEQAKQAVEDAQRNLDDCVLYSSFDGQIADVSVVPGSVVSPGKPVATVQMMDPIKIELEVSAEDSRRLRKRQRIPVELISQYADPDGEEKSGFLYLVDPTADPQTRTYTLTLLMLNEKNLMPDGENLAGLPVTDQTWKLDFSFLPGADEGKLYAPDEAIYQDAEGDFVWRVTDLTIDQNLPPDRTVSVERMSVERATTRIPFLGNWNFQEVVVNDDSFDPQQDLIVGKLKTSDNDPGNWRGDKVLISRDADWMVRPGDLVRVDLSDGDSSPGLFVPMDAVVQEEGKSFIFLIDEAESPDGDASSGETTVKKHEVTVARAGSSLSSLLRIETLS
ncbi:MAG TPA: hypothetical protein DDW52_16310, partial [Planctomycetaceae bacterium]|nr:hypothetical protein [Planctomycetaceae bacterium]